MPAREMRRVTAPQMFEPEEGGYDCCPQIFRSAPETGELASVGEEDKIGISAKLRRTCPMLAVSLDV